MLDYSAFRVRLVALTDERGQTWCNRMVGMFHDLEDTMRKREKDLAPLAVLADHLADEGRLGLLTAADDPVRELIGLRRQLDDLRAALSERWTVESVEQNVEQWAHLTTRVTLVGLHANPRLLAHGFLAMLEGAMAEAAFERAVRVRRTETMDGWVTVARQAVGPDGAWSDLAPPVRERRSGMALDFATAVDGDLMTREYGTAMDVDFGSSGEFMVARGVDGETVRTRPPLRPPATGVPGPGRRRRG